MSSIPAAAMPKAAPAEAETAPEAASPGFARRAAGLVRDNPKTAIAAGAAVAAGVAAAAAIPLVRARRGSGGSSSSGTGGKSGGKAKKR